MLQHWLPEHELNKLPHYTTHFVGVGGVVINPETDEILVIQEKTSVVDSKFADSKLSVDMWKIPGGLVDEGENIPIAVEREV
jgi:ADP-ribose pyrophosphatase YjhB (NUDIX family)